MNKQIVLLPGDGVGKEIMSSVKLVLGAIAIEFGHNFDLTEYAIGGEAYDRFKTPLPDETLAACIQADAILLGAVGGEKWETVPQHLRPEQGLLKIRKKLGLFANIRPIQSFSYLLHASPLKEENIKGSDIL